MRRSDCDGRARVLAVDKAVVLVLEFVSANEDAGWYGIIRAVDHKRDDVSNPTYSALTKALDLGLLVNSKERSGSGSCSITAEGIQWLDEYNLRT